MMLVRVSTLVPTHSCVFNARAHQVSPIFAPSFFENRSLHSVSKAIVYFANESNTDVYFDDLTHRQLIAQENNYYPFGMEMVGTGYSEDEQQRHKYGYNGKEEISAFGLQWQDYGARNYDSQLGRFNMIDRFSEKYYGLNPYQYAANNPVLFIDVNGDSLRLHGGAEERGMFESMMNKAFGGDVTVTVSSDGAVSMSGDETKLDEKGKALYGVMFEMISNENWTDAVLLDKSTGRTAVKGGFRGAKANGKDVNSIDLYDISKISSPDLSQQGFIVHELYETFLDQNSYQSLDEADAYKITHEAANLKQSEVDGVSMLKNKVLNKTSRFSLYEKCGMLYTLRVRTSLDRQIIDSKTVSGWTSTKQNNNDGKPLILKIFQEYQQYMKNKNK